MEQTESERVSLCFDTGHHAYRGGDAGTFVRKYHTKIRYLHLKNVDPQIRTRVGAKHMSLGDATELGIFGQLDQGMIDFLALRDVLQEIVYDGWAIAEQDMYPVPFDKPLPTARRARAYLREIGIG